METMHPPEISDDDDDKLIPEWQATADDQVLWAGLAVVAALGLLFAWNVLFGGDDVDPDSVAADLLEQLPEATVDSEPDGTGLTTGLAGAAAAVTGGATSDSTAGTDANSSATAEEDGAAAAEGDSTAAAADETAASSTTSTPVATIDQDQLAAALGGVPGSVTASTAAGAENPVTVTGFVANDGEAAQVVAAVEAVPEVDSVVDELTRLEPAAQAALTEAGVPEPAASGQGTQLTVSGVLQSEGDRADALAAVDAVPGVTSVVDRLTVSVADSLNSLPTVPFATNSDQILAGGQAIIDEAAAIINQAEGVRFEVQGYTDTVGDETRNLQLSADRAAAVTAALIEAGVDADRLQAQGYGETEQFGAGDSAEALAANRVVRFAQIG
jgi:outer membrane protein OmpA-like peptidoglycan-associated protein